MEGLKNIEPKEVFSFFETISNIPRGSGNEKRISDYIMSVAMANNLEAYQDRFFNVIVKKRGTKGYEKSKAVVFQGHMDMVCEKNFDVDFDFLVDPIKLLVKNDLITADGTTLGADNGIAVAYMLALLVSKDIIHPPIEAIFTADEEAGMTGAKNLDYSLISGRQLINLDSEEEGHILASCAGGIKVDLTLPVTWLKPKEEFLNCKIVIKGLKGGHSGADIHFQRANANKLMGRLLNTLLAENLVWINSINGGCMDNAIPRECQVILCFKPENTGIIKGLCEAFENTCNKEYKNVDNEIKVRVNDEPDCVDRVFSDITATKVVSILMLIPDGVRTVNMDIKGLVESSNNLGVVETDGENVVFACAIRSALASRKEIIKEELKAVANICGAKCSGTKEYPAWEYRKESPLRDVLFETYKQITGQEPKIEAIHAGLECGLFDENLKGCDMVSIGPDMFDVHTPEERISISSVSRTWEYIKKILKNLK